MNYSHIYKNNPQPYIDNIRQMGGSLACLCPYRDSKNREVLVMKEDGELIRFGQGIYVKDVLAAYPYHKIIPCRSDRSVLLDSDQLSCNRLYFLLPEGLAVSDATYNSLVKAAASSELIVLPKADRKIPPEYDSIAGDRRVVESDESLFGDFGYEKSPPWRPSLHTIPEVISPPHHANIV